jgi:hypothetical protein
MKILTGISMKILEEKYYWIVTREYWDGKVWIVEAVFKVPKKT